MPDLSALKALQARIRQATGPDRELDCLIPAVFDGRTIREENNMILARSSRPPYDEYLVGRIDPGRKHRNFSEPFGVRPSPHFTTYPEGLGACVALMMEVSPDAYWSISRTALRPGMIPGGSPHAYRAEVGDWGTPSKAWHDRPNHALLLAICAALIAQLEARETVG
jgi:hypothetical protein